MPKKSRKKQALIDALIVMVAIGIFLSGSVLIWISTFKIPTLDTFEERKVVESTKIYDRTGEIVLYDVFQDIKRTVVPFEDISENVKEATLAIEDIDFYSHAGVKPTALVRAMWVNFQEGAFVQGGSTITQQVIKNSVLTNEKTITRKLKEWVLALRLERILDKDEIFSLYLNEIPYGGSVYGIEEASYAFFGKSSADLTIAEAAYLASLPKAPTYYSPFGSHRDALEARKNLVLSEMLENGFITQGEYDEARNEQVTFIDGGGRGIKAPHFVLLVREQLAEEYGEQALEEEGLRVITTLDWELQEKAEEIVNTFALENDSKFNASNAAMVAIDPKTGGVLTMVGSRDYFDEKIDGNFNAATAGNRQPGSSFKPFVYAKAFEKGYTPETILFDVQTQFSARCPAGDTRNDGVCYSPNNYDNIFRGPISIRNALAQSVNVPAVKAIYLAGLDDSVEFARKMGVKTLDEDGDRYGLTLALGGGEVSLLDMTSAYGVFANDGVRHEYKTILKVTDKSGKVLEEYKPEEDEGDEVMDPNVARNISSILSDNNARTPAFGANSPLYYPGYQVAAKTGTTNDYRDAWILGYTPNIAIGAWAGNNDNTPMSKQVAGFIIAPMWNAVMSEALTMVPKESFQVPKEEDPNLKPILRGVWQGGSVTTRQTDSENDSSTATTERIYTGGVHSILHWVDKDDPRGPTPRNPNRDPQYSNWEFAVARWAGATYGDAEDVEIDGPQQEIIPPEILQQILDAQAAQRGADTEN